jgi:glycosyltransferase involved in cell wall biosynthesis
MEDSVKSLVSVCVPTLGRPEKLQRCLKAIEDNTKDWPHEVVVEQDVFGPGRRGCPRTLAAAVERATGAYIAFIGNDCLVQPGWLRIAMECMDKTFPDGVGLVALNDGIWHGSLATHWVASKALLPMIGGEFFPTCYFHVACDNELTARCKQLGRFSYAEGARVFHEHPCQADGWHSELVDDVFQLAWRQKNVAHDRALLAERAERMGFAPWLPK